MKKLLIVAMSILFVVGMTSMAMAVGAGAGIGGSPHDFSTAPDNQGNETGEICVVCHAPHKATQGSDLLWNRANSSNDGNYTLYNSTSLEVSAGQPSGSSKLCLTCHDGTQAVDAFGGDTNNTVAMAAGMVVTSGTLGDDLSTTHPISIVYTEGALTGMNDISSVAMGTQTLASLMDLGTILQCSTCHDVHDSTGEAVASTELLRSTNAGSALCLKCHAK